jgi:uncharacterized protein YndB with AHSA1/START domain
MTSNPIVIKITVHAPISKVWECWTQPEHITKWNFASDDWECPKASNDLRVGGKFSSTMAAKDGSASFDFEGIYSQVVDHKKITYGLADGREIETTFEEIDGGVLITETFDPENENSREMQQGGWQAILDNFKKHVESHE